MILNNIKQLQYLRQGGNINRSILEGALNIIRPNITTLDIETFVSKKIQEYEVQPAFLGYDAGDGPYPFATCVSVNHQLVHTLPSKKSKIKKGDLVTIDMGVIYKGLNTDTAYTVEVGNGHVHDVFLSAGKAGLNNALKKAKVGNRIGDLSYEMQKSAEGAGFNVSVDLVGHGIGKKLHEPPQIPCYGKKDTGERLKEGMVLAIEIMYMQGSPKLTIGEDGFSLDTFDGSLSAQFEHTVVIGKKGCEILV